MYAREVDAAMPLLNSTFQCEDVQLGVLSSRNWWEIPGRSE